MRIAILGGGTAGFIAAAHLTRVFPEFELFHVYDSRLGTIGVGEGTTPGFAQWLGETTRLPFEDLQHRCHVTRKFGIQFQNWGRRYESFFHHFYPARTRYAYHISADELVVLLKDYVTASLLDRRVTRLESDGLSVRVGFDDADDLVVDFAIDARGFPEPSEPSLELSGIPTNAALIRQGPPVDEQILTHQIGDRSLQYRSATRSIARPHGWIFTIPLTHRTSYGYLYNSSLQNEREIADDFDAFVAGEKIDCFAGERRLSFPSFVASTLFDGALFRIGNRASFLEPLEATAIEIIVKQVLVFSYWPLRTLRGQTTREALPAREIDVLNRHLSSYVQRVGLFVAWHYAEGSSFDTAFWRYARNAYRRERDRLESDPSGELFDDYVAFAETRPHPFDAFDRFIGHEGRDHGTYALWSVGSFAEVGHGIGYYSR